MNKVYFAQIGGFDEPQEIDLFDTICKDNQRMWCFWVDIKNGVQETRVVILGEKRGI